MNYDDPSDDDDDSGGGEARERDKNLKWNYIKMKKSN